MSKTPDALICEAYMSMIKIILEENKCNYTLSHLHLSCISNPTYAIKQISPIINTIKNEKKVSTDTCCQLTTILKNSIIV